MKKMIYVLVGGLLIAGLIIASNINSKKQEALERQMVTQYQECLTDNFNQRDYCAKKQGTDYRILDQLVKEYK